MSSISRRIAVITCSRPTGHGGRARQRDVDGVGGEADVELAALELRPARLDRGLERLARLVGRAADRAALLGGSCGDAAQQVRQLGLAAEVGDPRLLQLGGAGGGRDRRGAVGLQLLDPLPHARATLVTS